MTQGTPTAPTALCPGVKAAGLSALNAILE
jgi:hypothetical protein